MRRSRQARAQPDPPTKPSYRTACCSTQLRSRPAPSQVPNPRPPAPPVAAHQLHSSPPQPQLPLHRHSPQRSSSPVPPPHLEHRLLCLPGSIAVDGVPPILVLPLRLAALPSRPARAPLLPAAC